MKIRITFIIAILFIFTIASIAQNKKNLSEHKAKKIFPSEETIVNNKPVKLHPTISADLFTTDYDYAGNNSRPSMLWPYDIDGDGVLDPIGTGMQRFDGGARSQQLFAGLGGEFTWFPVSDPFLTTGWGGVQSLTEGPWAGKTLIMMHQGGLSKYSLVDLASFTFDVTHQDVDATNSTNFPQFVYMPDGTIYWVSDAGNLFQSTDQLASSNLVTNVIPQDATDAPAELILKRSPNGQYIFQPAAFSNNGSIIDGASQEEADFVSAYCSTDSGTNWTFEKIGYEGYITISNRPNYMPLFSNFAQLDGAVDNNGTMHVVINGNSLDLASDTTVVFPVYYYNSLLDSWQAVTTVDMETTPQILDYYPGNGIGNSYPTVAVTEDGDAVVIVWQAPEVVSGTLNIYPGDGGDASLASYYTDIYYVISTDGGETFSEPMKLDGEPNRADYYPYASAGGLEVLSNGNLRLHYMYMVDAVPGCSLFGENSASNDSYWIYDSKDFDYNGTVTSFQSVISVRDAGGSSSGLDLILGTSSKGTDGLDSGLGEIELPPLPPAGAFDARFILPDGLTASLKDIRNNDLTSAEWIMQFQPSTAGYPITFSWDNTKLAEYGSFKLTDNITGTLINVDMTSVSSYELTNSNISQLKIVYSQSKCVDVSYDNGWNLLSMPIKAEDMSKATLFPESNSNAFEFGGGYQIADSLETSKGFWLRFPSSGSVNVCGSSDVKNIVVNNGWNMIGVYDNDVAVSSITTNPSNIITSNFFGFKYGYQIVDTLKKGKGYWVKVSSNGEILSGNLKKGTEEIEGNRNNWTEIVIKDRNNSVGRLYLSGEEVIKGELPPVPPSGIFDVRYSTDRYVERGNNLWNRVELSSAEYPIEIRSNNGEVEIKIQKGEGEEIIRLGENESYTIGGSITGLEIRGKSEVLTSFRLEQNYPNPFNPTTVIKFAIPNVIRSEAKQSLGVTLKIYDILGNEVATLVNEQKEAGYYEVRFDAKNLASGMYIYRITADKFSDVKKMLLIK